MRTKSTELMNRISDFVGDYYRREHRSPTMQTIADAMGVCKATAYKYLKAMTEKGMLSYDGHEVSNLPKIEKTRSGYFSAPLVGSVRCGDPETEEEQVEMYVSLPEAIFGKGQFYLLRADGDSMEDAGISDGDLILIEKQHSCEVGDVVVALDENSENTLKVFGGIDKKTNQAVLKYANEDVYPGKTIKVKKLTVQGVARRVIKSI